MDQPIALDTVLNSFTDTWSPRIVTTVNDYDVRVAKVAGTHVWHAHADTDEFFLVLAGTLTIEIRDGAQRTVTLPTGSVFTVPKGVEHRPSSPGGAQILMLEPSGTVTTGDHEGDLPSGVDSTTGRTYTAG